MDYDEYRKAFFVDPPPEPLYQYEGIHGITLYFNKYNDAIQYYRQVLGPPAYIEVENTHGWRIGNSWLTIFPSNEGSPQNVEFIFVMKSPDEADRLQRAFIKAGGEGFDPSEELMYEPIRMCPVTDPFGVNILIISPLDRKKAT